MGGEEGPGSEPASSSKSRTYLKVAIAVLAVAALFAATRFLPIGELVVSFAEWVRSAGLPGALVYGLVYVAACVALVPASLLTLAAGFVYGPWLGTLLVSPASVLGATAAFLLGRTLLRGWAERRLGKRPMLRALDQAIGEGGLRMVALLRLSPLLPFNLLNYALSLTRVSTRDFVLGSLIGMLPVTFLYVYLGSIASSLTELAHGKAPSSPWRHVALALGLVATVVVTALITRRAKAALQRHVPEVGAKPPEDGARPAEDDAKPAKGGA